MRVREIQAQLRADLATGVLADALLTSAPLVARVREHFRFERLEGADDISSATGEVPPPVAGALVQSLDLDDGLIRLDDSGSAVVIENLSASSSSVYVRTLGDTEACRRVLRDFAQILLEFGVDHLESGIESYAYATLTLVELDFGVETMLSPTFVDLLDGPVAKAARETREDSTILVHPYKLNFKIHVSSEGPPPHTESLNLSFGHRRFADHDARIFEVYSEFPSDAHLDVLTTLEGALESGAP